ncbi:ABC transporter permease [Albimonas sp. CAU 1670]|uniref:ABC transporter permease n=1 Tax=Albimonas sp. CAU 1670 TaxID=3032599 RepID=UPI0023DCB643|nr:ABC transporter permease [Albimonas sp. CAU 1670]MDF2234285.1 ABC transporter permease [Albimonas sp. CAU 1670]
MALQPYASTGQRIWYYTFRVICGLIFFFLIFPILIIIPLSFNALPYFTFTPGMLALEADAYSLEHYRDFLKVTGENWESGWWVLGLVGAILVGGLTWLSGGRAVKLVVLTLVGAVVGAVIGRLAGVEGPWLSPLSNSLAIAPAATLLSVSLGTLAAIGLSSGKTPFRGAIMAILISPMIVPLIISAAGMYFFYSRIGLQGTYWGVVLAHAALGVPFVIITVTATLVGFDRSLTRAAANMGAGPVRTFFKVQMPLILPGVISGGLFAFITSFDEVVVVLFLGSAGQKTLPWQMFTGLREQISPTILAVATLLVTMSVILLATLEILRRRSERLRGMSPG